MGGNVKHCAGTVDLMVELNGISTIDMGGNVKHYLPRAGRPYGRTARWPSVQPYSTVLPLSDSSETFKHTPVYSLKPIQNIFYL